MLLGAVWATTAAAQTFLPQGPAPSFGPWDLIQSNDAPPNGTVGGAIQAVLPHPTDANTMYVGGVNGGVWVTRDGGGNWTPLSDKQRSLSIASLAFDPTDATRRTLVAGVGLTSNGAVGIPEVANRGGERIGLLYSNNGGTSWNELGGATLSGKSIVGVAARGGTLLAAAAEPHDATAPGGLYRSTNGGTSFNLVSGTGGLASGAVSSLAGETANQSVFYAAVSATGVYRSSNNGADWNQVLSLGANRIARVATGPAGTIAVGIYDSAAAPPRGSSPTGGQLVAIQHSTDSGATWTSLAVPQINFGRQASTDFAIAVDPTNPNIVYVAGDRIDTSPFTVTAYRIVRQGGTSTIETLTDSGTSDGSTTHADARTLVFDALGRMIQGGDGGLYVRSNPQGVGTWTGLNTAGLSLREAYAVAYDSISRRLVVSAQDTGSAYQSAPGSQAYNAIGGGGDGVNAQVNDKTLRSQGRSITYTTSQNMAPLIRRVVDAQGNVVSESVLGTRQGQSGLVGAARDDFTSPPRRFPERGLPFGSLFVLNRIDPQMIAIGSNYVYTTEDAGGTARRLFLNNLATPGSPVGPISALAYGTRDNINALIAGSESGLYRATTAVAGSLQRLTGYAGEAPTSLVFDNRTQTRFFAADMDKLWGTTNGGTSFTDLSASLAPANIIRPTAVDFISNNGVNALLVGGLNNIVNAQSPIAVADSDIAGALSDWRAFGFGLPNTFANQLHYNEFADVLAVGLYGRGAWLLYDVTTYFPTATVLRFGAADNDSTPDVSLLTGARNLEKVGTGTLTIEGTPTYSGATLVEGGLLTANGSLMSSSSITVGARGTLGGTGTVPSTTVNGALAPGNSIGTLTVNGNLTFNAGSAYQVELAGAANDRTNVTGTATLAGTTQATYGGTSFTRTPNTILSAAGGLTGTFQNLTTVGLPSFLSGRLAYSASDVTISLQSGMTSMAGVRGNQSAVARAFDTAFNAGSGLNGMPGLYGLSAGQLPQALSTLSGDSASVGQSAALAASGQFATILTERAGTRRAEELACVNRPTEAANTCAGTPPDWSAWTSAFGGTQWLNAYAPNGSAASQQNVSGVAFGSDYRAGPDTLVGAAIGYGSLNVSMPTNGASGQATGVQLGVYGQHDWRSFYLNASMAFSRFEGSTTRSITGIGTPETARASTVSTQLAGRVEVGRPFEIGKTGVSQFGLTPFAALQPAQFWQPATTETSTTGTGAPGVFALGYQAQSTTSLPMFLGAQLDGRTEVNGLPLNAWLRLAWVHEFMPGRPVTAGFVNLPGSLFTVDGAQAASDAARIDLGAKYAVGQQTSLFANVSTELSNRGQGYSGSVGFRMTW